jgi:hypothetical protein
MMERPYQLYCLLNTPFHTLSRSAQVMQSHLHFRAFCCCSAHSATGQSSSGSAEPFTGRSESGSGRRWDMVTHPDVQLKAGKRLTFAAPTSASKRGESPWASVMGCFTSWRGPRGFDIQCISFVPREQEVLLPPPFIVQVSTGYAAPRGLVVISSTCPNETKYLEHLSRETL